MCVRSRFDAIPYPYLLLVGTCVEKDSVLLALWFTYVLMRDTMTLPCEFVEGLVISFIFQRFCSLSALLLI